MLQGTNGLKGLLILTAFCVLYSCKKGSSPSTPVTPVVPASFSFNSLKVNGVIINTSVVNGLNTSPVIKISFTAPVKTSSVAGSVSLTGGTTTPTFTTAYSNNDSTIVITPNGLSHLTAYTLSISTNLKDAKNGGLQTPFNINLRTAIDSTNKFTTITDDALLTLVQQQTFNYFWSGANTTSGLAYRAYYGWCTLAACYHWGIWFRYYGDSSRSKQGVYYPRAGFAKNADYCCFPEKCPNVPWRISALDGWYYG